MQYIKRGFVKSFIYIKTARFSPVTKFLRAFSMKPEEFTDRPSCLFWCNWLPYIFHNPIVKKTFRICDFFTEWCLHLHINGLYLFSATKPHLMSFSCQIPQPMLSTEVHTPRGIRGVSLILTWKLRSVIIEQESVHLRYIRYTFFNLTCLILFKLTHGFQSHPTSWVVSEKLHFQSQCWNKTIFSSTKTIITKKRSNFR